MCERNLDSEKLYFIDKQTWEEDLEPDSVELGDIDHSSTGTLWKKAELAMYSLAHKSFLVGYNSG